MNEDFKKTPAEQQHLMESDNQTEKVDRLLDFFLIHKNTIIAVAVAAIVAAGTLVFLNQRNYSSEEDASRLLSEAAAVMDDGDFRRALDGDASLKGLRELSEIHGSSPSGNFAKILAGDCYFALGETDSALQAYGSYAGKNKNLAAAATAGEAACLLMKKEFTKASASLRKASETALNPALKALYLSDAADASLDAGDVREAATTAGQVIENYPGYASAAKARTLLLSLAPLTGETVR
ncbi:tetratricopeptide repeat protein [Prosthecochloris sp. GSB1]|uniref:tetratricopeptide repeat protein n=1 Tax=Prosthecochloris sp. GSB1 TaxID=281093 RepID=UPI0012371FD8|nr:tetratricopeptide repeat protein [Prosthecochloris sp. GSB1]